MKFSDLQNAENRCGVVMTALKFNPDEKADLIAQMNEAFTESGFLINGAKVLDVEKIEGNVLGNAGRTDVYIRLDKYEVDPMVRISKWRDIKWLEDFIANYANDYYTMEVE